MLSCTRTSVPSLLTKRCRESTALNSTPELRMPGKLLKTAETRRVRSFQALASNFTG